MPAIAFFNNKGGVGKTTFACNMAAYFSHNHGERVLLVDADPQCNATQLTLSEEQWEDLYGNRDDAEARTLLKAFRQIRAGDSTLETDLAFQRSDRFKIDVLAGHPSVSTIEDVLSSSWIEYLGGTLGGARRSIWASTLVQRLTADYDKVFFDCGPSLGALNRSVLIGSDYFLTPMAADMFSLYALDNIGEWMARWLDQYSSGYQRTLANAGNSEIERYQVKAMPPVAKGYVGYSIQQYVARSSGGHLRAVKAYDRYKTEIPERSQVLQAYRAETVSNLDLGVVPNMFSMVPTAQNAHAPIFDLKQSDGLRGAQVSQQTKYAQQLQELGARIAGNL